MSLALGGSPVIQGFTSTLTRTLASLAFSSAAALGIAAVVEGPQSVPQAVCGDPYGGCYPASEDGEVSHPLFRNDLPRISLPSKIGDEMRIEEKDPGDLTIDGSGWIILGALFLLTVIVLAGVCGFYEEDQSHEEDESW